MSAKVTVFVSRSRARSHELASPARGLIRDGNGDATVTLVGGRACGTTGAIGDAEATGTRSRCDKRVEQVPAWLGPRVLAKRSCLSGSRDRKYG